MKREVLICDVCDREIPLDGRGKSQLSYRVVKRTWWWIRTNEGERDSPEHVCEECWDAMVKAARALALTRKASA